MTALTIHIDRWVATAYEDLSFFHQRQSAALKQQVALLSQRSPEQINRYLSIRAFRLREISRKTHKINPDGLYVVSKVLEDKNKNSDSFECSYLYGTTFYEPPLVLWTSDQLKEMWEYLLALPKNKYVLPFQDFLEEKIAEVILALYEYEDMLDQEIAPLEYVMLSSQAVPVHNALYSLAKDTLRGLREQARLFKNGNVPIFMQNDLAKKIKIAKNTVVILENSHPRNT